jgi:hypothetical protein
MKGQSKTTRWVDYTALRLAGKRPETPREASE